MKIHFWIFSAILSLVSGVASAESELTKRWRFWESEALNCTFSGGTFPSKRSGESQQPCDDGDMTLFNGLLCASGDIRGCNGVRDALDSTTGIWHRSPRIRDIGANDRGNADSSPDMALGIQLYLTVTKDISRAEKWLHYLNSNYLCYPSEQICLLKLPKFCKTSDCVLRPQDAALLDVTVKWLQRNASLKPLDPGPLKDMLDNIKLNIPALLKANAEYNELGFPLHLAGVGVLLVKMSGVVSADLETAGRVASNRSPGNAFFSWLAQAPTIQIRTELLARCPAEISDLKQPLHQWQWERDNLPNSSSGLFAWQQSSLWDCIFIAQLIAPEESPRGMPPPLVKR